MVNKNMQGLCQCLSQHSIPKSRSKYFLSPIAIQLIDLIARVIIIGQNIPTGKEKDQSDSNNHKGCRLGCLEKMQSIDLLAKLTEFPDSQIGTVNKTGIFVVKEHTKDSIYK
ncbi:hypothetical protein TTHERM_001322644 (macronuclear) [Tetrahymena thermophila SB210]|uniref:Uncharacterized protein n=1 Tax=Tetrahymena thermophila (strain SB210) TaxID=312017 RepID=W7XJV3_TETTS|nr:hypothetical protein TTHERM_001322644 [Tetrahymena thermophila SB210]EWS74359.1 hypothetical protein TTHERM_001322644 [Tetrahymena thermophila SB210]|eukprot:XP_012653102.1 hypothetical protein TTHERM_001322644 [Tetrahymena thermophila SB210]